MPLIIKPPSVVHIDLCIVPSTNPKLSVDDLGNMTDMSASGLAKLSMRSTYDEFIAQIRNIFDENKHDVQGNMYDDEDSIPNGRGVKKLENIRIAVVWPSTILGNLGSLARMSVTNDEELLNVVVLIERTQLAICFVAFCTVAGVDN